MEILELASLPPLLAALLVSSSGALARGPAPLTDPRARMEAFARFQEKRARSPYRRLHWQFVGPTNIGGRAVDIAVVTPKGKSYTIYAATASGGVWKTVNEGVTWEPVFERAASTSIGDIALDPRNPDVVWVGTGEANIFRSSMAGCGVFKSADGGKTWKHMGLTATHTIARIVIDPTDPRTVYVAASGHEWTPNPERGVFKTTDGGKTWKKILYVDEWTGAIDLVMDPKDPRILYAATWQRIRRKWNDPRNDSGSRGSGIYKTTDGGKTWKLIVEGLPPARYRGRIGIDIARSNPRVLYAFVDDYTPAKARGVDSYGRPRKDGIVGASVYRSDDAGESWRLVSGKTRRMKAYMRRHSATYGWVFGQIRVDPNDENKVYTLGLALNVSTDGGKTFHPLRGMHGDHHGLWIDPSNSNYLVDANDGGVSVSYDGGKHWMSWTRGIHAAQFFDLALDTAEPFHVYGSVQDQGSMRGVVDLSRGRDRIPAVEFERAPGGEGSRHAVDPENPDLVYSAGFYGRLTRTDLSRRPGSRRKSIFPRVYEDEPPLRRQWLAPFILSPHNPSIIYYGAQYLFRSRDRGDTWERISPDLTWNDPKKSGDIPYQTIFTVSESPLMFGLVYAGTDDGRVHRTRDGGKTWVEITKGLAPGKWIACLEASRYAMGTVYLVQNGKRDDDFAPYVWKSADYGRTWLDISKGVPLGPVNVIREDPRRRGTLYLGTDLGVFLSTDGGKTWDVLGDLPSTYVHDIQVHPRDRIVVIATHGRGIWALDADTIRSGGGRAGRRRSR